MRLLPILIGLIIVVVVGGLIFLGADTIGTSDQYGVGIIVDKEFIPEHEVTTMTYSDFCKCMETSTTYYDDEWRVQVNMTGKLGYLEVSESMFNALSHGGKAHITYYVGRFSDTIYFKSVEPNE